MKNFTQKFHLLLFVLCTINLNSFAQNDYFSNVNVITDVVYGSNIGIITQAPQLEDLSMDIYMPEGDESSNRPVIILLHTGGFLPPIVNGTPNGDKTDLAIVEMCTQFAKKGFVAVSPNYRLGWNPLSTNPEVRAKTLLEAIYRAQQDARTAIRFLRKTRYEYGNPYGIGNDFILGGEGSGGTIALTVASLDKDYELLLPNFIDYSDNAIQTYGQPNPYIDQSVLGNFFATNTGNFILDDGTSTPLCIPNHTEYSSDISMAFNFGGAILDSTWIEYGDVPIASMQNINDELYPYDVGIITEPVNNDPIIEMFGSLPVIRRSTTLGNNDCFDGLSTTLIDAIYGNGDGAANAALAGHNDMLGLFPIVTPDQSNVTQCGMGQPDHSPWQWWDSDAYGLAAEDYYSQYGYPSSIWNCLATLSNPNMSEHKGLAYIDMLQDFFHPRINKALGTYITTACPYNIYLEYESEAEAYSEDECLTLIAYGCLDPESSNFNPFANSDDGSCEYIEGCMDEISPNYSFDAVLDDGSCIYISGCTNESASNYNQDATTDDGSCIINGCTDIIAVNYSDIATQDDSSCIYEGCTISSANNYNPNASINDNSCIILGCMLDVFPNYNPIATQSDGSCSFSAEEIIIGCTNQDTWTYNPNANFEDGSCSYEEIQIGKIGQGGIVFHIDTTNQVAYIASEYDLDEKYKWGCFGDFIDGVYASEIGTGFQNTTNIVENNCLLVDRTETYINGSYIFEFSEPYIGQTAAGAAADYQQLGYDDWYLPSKDELTTIYFSIGQGSSLGNIGGFENTDYWSSTAQQGYNDEYAWVVSSSGGSNGYAKFADHNVRPIRHFNYSSSGCTNPSAFNYQPIATADDGSCIAVVEGCLSSWADNYNPQANTADNSCYLNGCTSVWADNYNSQATLDDGSCLLAGCMSQWAENYDQNATSNDGSCYLNGCMSHWADNYNSQATIDDGSCSLAGCMLEFAENYNVYVTVDDGSCEITGCTNEFAMNFDNSATQDDGSCTYYNTANIPDAELLNYLKADYPDAIVNDSLNIDQAHLITSININLASFDISSFDGLESCTNIEELRIEGSSVSDLSPLYNNTGIRWLIIQGGNFTSESINSLLSIQTSIESIMIHDNTSIDEFNLLLPNHFMDMIMISNTEIESINLMVDGLTFIDISGNHELQTINGIGDFDIHTWLQIAENESLISINGSTLSDNYNEFNWQQESVFIYGNPLLNSCCPLGGFPNYVINSFGLSYADNGENCSSGNSINAYYEANCAPGCTDPSALNYNPNITEDDGSCEYCPEIEIVAAVSNISCITNDADVSVTVYPAGNYNFEWSSGQTTSTLYDIPNDAYTVTVTNQDGCSESLDIALETPSEISIEANVIDDDLGQCEGEILTTISGGDGEYSFQWYDDNNQTTQNATDLCAGNYLIEVTDGSGCSASASFDVGGGIPWTYGITGSNHSLFIQESTIFNLYESEISFGDYIGAFYMDEATGELKCGGYTIWQETQVVIPIWGDDTDTEEKDGFFENDLIIIGVYDNSEGREYFGESIFFNNFPNSQYFATNGFSSLQEFNGMPSPTWHVENTGNSHSIMLTEFNPYIGEEALLYGDFIGIFFNDQDGNLRCGGKTIWTGQNNSLTAWGDDPFTPEKDGFMSGETFIWKVWKASQLESFTTIPSFSPNFNLGNFAVNGMSVLLALDINVNQTLNLPGGWSMFSLNIILDDYSTPNVFSQIIDQVSLVKNYLGMAYLPEWNYNGIGDLNNTEGYQIKLSSPQSLTLSGGYVYPENHPLYLPSGWSIISYLRTTAASASSVLEGLNETGNLLIAKNYLGLAYLPDWNYNGIGDMVPGQGYQIKLVEADTLVYLGNNTEYRFTSLPTIDSQTSLCKAPIHTDNNMTVIIPDKAWDKLPSKYAEILAYDELGEIIGCAKYTSPVTVLTLWGNDEITPHKDGMHVSEQTSFKVLDKDLIRDLKIKVWIEGSEVYEVNAINVASSIIIQSEEIESDNLNNKSLAKVINLLGQEVNESTSQIGRILFRVYDDGSVEKFIK